MNFENTQIAFAYKNDAELKNAYMLYKMIGNNFLVKTGGALAKTAVNVRFPIGWAVKPTIYKLFVGGETMESCNSIIENFAKHNVKIVLDYSVEGGKTDAQIQHALDETLRTIDNAANNSNIPYAVFKPTAFGLPEILEKAGEGKSLNEIEQKEAEKFEIRVKQLCQRAYEKNVPIMIDAEDYAYQNYVDDVVYKMMLLYNKEKAIVFNTLQMYRKDRLEFLHQLYEQAQKDNIYVGIKFVRGAYMERERARAARLGYEDPIHPNKQATDDAYNAALKFSIEHIDRISIFNATHNEYSCQYMAKLMQENNIVKTDKRCYFSQLYGMSDNITFNLAQEGYNVAKYTPYGPIKHVLPYLIRRTEENTSVAGQTPRQLELLKKEIDRRKSLKK